MFRMKTIALALLAGAAMCASARADEVKLCTGAEGGVYDQAGGMIKSFAPSGLTITLVQSDGTFDNMDKINSGACDAMIGQPDGPVYLKRTNPGQAANLIPMMKLHREYLQVLCNHDSGITNLKQLAGETKYSVAIGANGSGAWLIWQNFTQADSDFAKVPVTSDSGITALSSVSSGQTTCMLVSSGVPNKIVAQADASFGDSVDLVSATSGYFNDAEDIDGKALYTWGKIPTDGYPNTYNKYWSNIKTISWLAGIYINKTTLKGKPLEQFLSAVARARTQITSQFGN